MNRIAATLLALTTLVACSNYSNNDDKSQPSVTATPTNSSEGDSNSSSDSAPTINKAPIAAAGQDRMVEVGSQVSLNGSESSDPEGSSLTADWTLIGKPLTSNAVIANQNSISTSFIPDQPGTYTVSLVVTDGEERSEPDYLVIQVKPINLAPVANAGPNQNGTVGSEIRLSSAQSYDPEMEQLSVVWSIVSKPTGSATALANLVTSDTRFTPDMEGTYSISLVVSDGELSSQADLVEIYVEIPNNPPTANAGDDLTVRLGETVYLDGSMSTDPEGSNLTASWALTITPSGSTAEIDSPSNIATNFTPDVEGQYIAKLIVHDGQYHSRPDGISIIVRPANILPTADAGTDQVVEIGTVVNLDGSASVDDDRTLLSYAWNIVSKPEGSAATLTDSTDKAPQFTADKLGNYQVELTVTDPDQAKSTAVITVTAATPLEGIINSNTQLTASMSPYILTNKVQVAYGATLSMAEGVKVFGMNKKLEVFGKLDLNGSPTSKVELISVNICAGDSTNSEERSTIEIDWAEILGGQLLSWPSGDLGALILRDSFLNNTLGIDLRYPSQDSWIERNIFVSSQGISVGLSRGPSLYVSNNVFYDMQQDRGEVYAIKNWALYGESQVVAEFNSFLDSDRNVLLLPSGYSTSNILAPNNYWGTIDTGKIDERIFDKNDDLSSANYIEYNPILTLPHPDTPVFEPSAE